MSIRNRELAALFLNVADLLEIDGANPFRIRAYRNAAQTIEHLTASLADWAEQGQALTGLPGIGADLAEKIRTVVRTGSLPLLAELEKRLPPGLLKLLRLPQLGPKRVRALYQKLHIQDLLGLQTALKDGRVRALPGFGAKLESQLLSAVGARSERPERFLRSEMEPVALELVAHLRAIQTARRVEIAGSYRRACETIGDLDILVAGTAASKIMDHFLTFEDIRSVQARGRTRSTVRLRQGLQVDVRIVPEKSFGSAWHYFTGSKSHNIAVRALGQERGLKINEYGVFKGSRAVAGRTEAEVYAQVGLDWIPPELRESKGEIEAAREHGLPTLIERGQLRGDLHLHTRETDGTLDLQGMAAAVQALGYEYFAVTDHSQKVTVAHGLDAKRLRRQLQDIDALNARLKGLVILKGLEVDILEDGSLDMDPAVLGELDLTVCSIHSGFRLSSERQTERILRAMDDPHFHILGHPTGRLLNEREGYAIDMERVVAGAKERGCFIELNAQPQRLDATADVCRSCKRLGVRVAISTDAHHPSDLDLIHLGVAQARRGWLEAEDVLNTRPLSELRALLRR